MEEEKLGPIIYPNEIIYPDNWKHRTEDMRCKKCMWFVRKGDKNIGRCRKHAPSMNGYPVVFEDDWCGDSKLDETK